MMKYTITKEWQSSRNIFCPAQSLTFLLSCKLGNYAQQFEEIFVIVIDSTEILSLQSENCCVVNTDMCLCV